MRFRTLAAATAALITTSVLPASAGAQQVSWLLEASLTGAAEVPGPGDPGGAGVAAVVLTWDPEAGYTACFTLAVVGLSTPAVAAHIHPGRADVAGPVAVPFEAPNPTASNCVPVSSEIGDQLATDPEAFYVNVHTSQFPGGAVRGQLTNPRAMMM